MINSYPFFEYTDKTLDRAVQSKWRHSGWSHGLDLHQHVWCAARCYSLGDGRDRIRRRGHRHCWNWVALQGWLEPTDANKNYVLSYIANLVKHVNLGQGTPLMSNRTFPTYIYDLFNENLKPNTSEQNFGLFNPDLTPVYNAGILQNKLVIFLIIK